MIGTSEGRRKHYFLARQAGLGICRIPVSPNHHLVHPYVQLYISPYTVFPAVALDSVTTEHFES